MKYPFHCRICPFAKTYKGEQHIRQLARCLQRSLEDLGIFSGTVFEEADRPTGTAGLRSQTLALVAIVPLSLHPYRPPPCGVLAKGPILTGRNTLQPVTFLPTFSADHHLIPNELNLALRIRAASPVSSLIQRNGYLSTFQCSTQSTPSVNHSPVCFTTKFFLAVCME